MNRFSYIDATSHLLHDAGERFTIDRSDKPGQVSRAVSGIVLSRCFGDSVSPLPSRSSLRRLTRFARRLVVQIVQGSRLRSDCLPGVASTLPVVIRQGIGKTGKRMALSEISNHASPLVKAWRNGRDKLMNDATRRHSWIRIDTPGFKDERCVYCRCVKRETSAPYFSHYFPDGAPSRIGPPPCEKRPVCECGEPKRWLGRWCRPEKHTAKRHPRRA